MYIMKKKNTNKQFAQALYEVIKGLKGEHLHQALKGFASLLVKAHKLKQADRILAEFIKYSKKREGIVEIEITSSRQLDGKVLTEIKKVFSEAEQKVESIELIDKNMLGGISVKTEDKIMDASLKTQLRKVKQSLI